MSKHHVAKSQNEIKMNERLSKLMPDYGKQIPGSRLFRCYCLGCQEPMRVIEADLNKDHWCEECSPRRPPAGSYGPYKDDAGPGWDNTVKAYEDK